MTGWKVDKRKVAHPCDDCGEDVWSVFVDVCDACFRIRWLPFARAMGWKLPEDEAGNTPAEEPVAPVMADILEDEEPGHYLVKVLGPMNEEEWTWQGYADSSVEALGNARDSRAADFRWDKERGLYVRV